MAPKTSLDCHLSCISGSDGRAHAGERGTARRRSDWSRCLRLQWRTGASFIGAAMTSMAWSGGFGHALGTVESRVVGGFRVAATPAKPLSDAVNSVAGKAMALLRRLFIEAVTIPACLSSRKSRAGPFNPPSGKISPAAKSASLPLCPPAACVRLFLRIARKARGGDGKAVNFFRHSSRPLRSKFSLLAGPPLRSSPPLTLQVNWPAYAAFPLEPSQGWSL